MEGPESRICKPHSAFKLRYSVFRRSLLTIQMRSLDVRKERDEMVSLQKGMDLSTEKVPGRKGGGNGGVT